MDKKTEKKRTKLIARIEELETNLRVSLQKKSSSQQEIDLPGTQRQIAQLKAELAALK